MIFRNDIRYFWSQFIRNMLAGKGIVRAGFGNKKGKEIVKADSGNEMDF